MKIKRIANKFFNRDIYIPNTKELFIIAFILGLVAYLELILLEPWNITSELHSASYLWLAYGTIETLTFLICFALPAIFHRKRKESFRCKTWKVIGLFAGHLLVTALFIIVHDMFYFSDILPNDFPILKAYIYTFGRVLIIGIFPFTLSAI